jgi:hypothetical protein
MNLNDLNKELPYKWRVQSFSKFKPQGQCVAYIDARDVQKRLDEVCGKENWQTLYYEVGSMLFCKIGININAEWVWKSDTGSESNIEKEKGHSSDAFKRAAVLWGVGRFLYDMKIQYVAANEVKTDKPPNWPYVIDNNGKRVWDLTEHINGGSKAAKKPAAKLMTREQSDKFAELCEKEGLLLGETAKAYGIRYVKNRMTSDEFEEAYKILNDNVKTGDIEMSLVIG